MTGLLDQGRATWAHYLWSTWTSGDWEQQSDEEREYGHRHMVEHLDDAQMPDEMAFALVDVGWMRAWAVLDNSYAGFMNDVERIWQRAEASGDLLMQLKCALCHSSVVTFSTNVPVSLLPLALEHRLVNSDQALDIARRKSHQEDRAEILTVIVPLLPLELLPVVLNIAETLTEDYHQYHRGSVLQAVLQRAPLQLHRRILALIGSMNRTYRTRAKTLALLAPELDPNLADEMLELARSENSPRLLVVALRGIAHSLPEAARDPILKEALEAARQIGLDEHRADALCSLVESSSGDLRDEVFREAFETARTIERIEFSAMKAPDHRAERLFELIPLAPAGMREVVIEETLHAIATQENNYERDRILGRVEEALGSGYIARALELLEQNKRKRKPEEAESPDNPSDDDGIYKVTDEDLGEDYVRARRLEDEVRNMTAGGGGERLAEIFDEGESLQPEDRLDLLHAALTKASEPLLPRIVGKLAVAAEQIGSVFDAGNKLFSVARTVLELPGEWTEDALRIVRMTSDSEERADALAQLSSLIAPAWRAEVIAEALDSARTLNDAKTRDKFVGALHSEPVDIGGVAADAFVVARAGPYADVDDEWDWGEENEEEEADLDASAELDRIRMIADDPKPDIGGRLAWEQARAIERLAPTLPKPQLSETLEVTLSIKTEDSRRHALVSLLPHLADEHWKKAASVADSIGDFDESGEAWIAIAQTAPDPNLVRRAVEEGLESIRQAHNEDDYPEPFLRLAYELPDDVLPIALDVAADLYVEDEPNRREEAFCGLAEQLESWVAKDPEAASDAWSATLHRLADRPRETFLRDLAGYHYFARILAGPEGDRELVQGLKQIVLDVCSWW